MNKLTRNIAMLFFASTCWFTAISQNNAPQSDDNQRIAIAPTLPTELQKLYPEGSLNILLNKMKTMVSLNGMSAVEGMNFVVIYPQISVLKSDVTATTPAMFVYRLDVIFNVADFYSGNVYATASQEVAGVGRTQQAAYTSAFQQITERAGKYKVMIEKAKNGILGYYNTHCDLVISKAKSLAAQHKYHEALDLLNGVPAVCRECFDKCNQTAQEIAVNMPIVTPREEPLVEPKEKVTPAENQELVELGNNIFIRYKSCRIIGAITTVFFELINKNEEDFDQQFYKIYETFIINEKGEELRIQNLKVGGKSNNYYLKATLIREVNTELICEFPKVKEIKMLRFLINDNLFRFKNITITK